MAKFRVFHIVRDGHVERDIVHARSRRAAFAEAKRKYDDVLAVKRDRSFPLMGVFLVVAALAVILFVVTR